MLLLESQEELLVLLECLNQLYVKRLYCINIDLLKFFLISKLHLEMCVLMVHKACQ